MNDSWSEQKNRISSYYEGLVGKFGHDTRACDYGSPVSQQRKFSVLSEAMPLANKTVLDVGCGFADFASYLTERFPGVSYQGVDISPAMVAGAKKARPDLNIRQLDILEENPGSYDFVTANGIFYLIKDSPETIMRRLVSRMFEISRSAVAFNSLSSWCPDKEDGEFYADPLANLEFCRTLTPWVVLRADYHPRDFTIYLYKNRT